MTKAHPGDQDLSLSGHGLFAIPQNPRQRGLYKPKGKVLAAQNERSLSEPRIKLRQKDGVFRYAVEKPYMIHATKGKRTQTLVRTVVEMYTAHLKQGTPYPMKHIRKVIQDARYVKG